MPTVTRGCRACGERFTVQRFDQTYCKECGAARRDVDLIEACLHSSPGQSVDWVAIATGVDADRIRSLASQGRLAAVPAGAELPGACQCEPGTTGRCGYCRAQLAQRFGEATYAATRAAGQPVRGMRMRRD
jgi:hypothetical protein